MKTVAIISKPGRPQLPDAVARLAKWLKHHQYALVADEATCFAMPGIECIAREEVPARKPEFVVVLGGDGTMLAAARAVAQAGIPILGVNLGSLGFMTESRLEELETTLDAVAQGKIVTDTRAMLHCQLVRGGQCVETWDALNDIVVNKAALARIVDFDVLVNGQFVSNYKADGIIVATPTGSTAYSLAAGGPVLGPSVDAFVITPVSPHSLTNRALVVPDSSEIAVEVKQTQEEAYLTVDGQTGVPLRKGDRIACKKSQHTVQLLHLPQRSFFDVLRTKLKWGER